MNVFIDDGYLELLEEKFAEEGKNLSLNSNVFTNIKQIYNMLCGLKIKTNIPHQEIEKIVKGNKGEKNYDTFKNSILSIAIKNQSIEMVRDKTLELGTFHFFNKSTKEVSTFEKYESVIVKDNMDSYEDLSVDHSSDIEGPFYKHIQYKEKATALVICDPYIFGNPTETKLENLKQFIDVYNNKSPKIKFQITIVTGQDESTTLIESRFKALSELNCEVQIIRISKPNRERKIYSDYFNMSIGHPFEDKKTTISKRFLGYGITSDEILKKMNNIYLT